MCTRAAVAWGSELYLGSVQVGTVSLGKPIPMFDTIDTTYLFYY